MDKKQLLEQANQWMPETISEADGKSKEIAAAIKKWLDSKKPYETTDNGTEKYEMNIEMGKPSPTGFNNNEIKAALPQIQKILRSNYKGKFNKLNLYTNKLYL